MAEKVLMLALSPTMETGTIVKWNRKEGDSVETGDVLCEIETDKATMEYESMNDGTLLKIIVAEGGNAAVGQSIGVVGEKDEDISVLLDEIAHESHDTGAGAEVSNISEEAAGGVQSKEGSAGSLREDSVLPGEEVSTVIEGGVLSTAAVSEASVFGKLPEAGSSIEPSLAKASPLARKLADRYGIALNRVQGSGPGGRIIKRDINAAHAAPGQMAPNQILSGQVPAGPAPVAEEIAVSGKRKVIAERLSQSKFGAPHYYLKAVIEVDGLMAARLKINKKRQNDKLTFNGFLVKFVAEALKQHPVVNSSWQGDRIVRFGRADIGIAVAQPDGLITPVLRDCWNRGIAGLDAELKLLIEKARANKLKPDEYTGATFTISSLGTYGIHEFTAIINPPGSAILAVGQARREPVVGENDEIQIQTNMTVILSCDHRVIDGAEGALFLNDLKDMIENPVFALY